MFTVFGVEMILGLSEDNLAGILKRIEGGEGVDEDVIEYWHGLLDKVYQACRVYFLEATLQPDNELRQAVFRKLNLLSTIIDRAFARGDSGLEDLTTIYDDDTGSMKLSKAKSGKSYHREAGYPGYLEVHTHIDEPESEGECGIFRGSDVPKRIKDWFATYHIKREPALSNMEAGLYLHNQSVQRAAVGKNRGIIPVGYN